MKQISCGLCFAALCVLALLWTTNALAVSLEKYELRDPEQVVAAYFHCLKEGDLESLGSLIGGKLFEKKRHLIYDANNYAEFLKNYYRNAQLISIEINQFDDDSIESNLQLSLGNNIIPFKLLLSRIDGTWVIIDDVTR